jgi:hypothetical protein
MLEAFCAGVVFEFKREYLRNPKQMIYAELRMSMQPSGSQDAGDASTAKVGNGTAVLRRGKGTTKERTESQPADLKSYSTTIFIFGTYVLDRQAQKVIESS